MAQSISAIMVTRGDASFLPLAVESLRAQPAAALEVILVDASRDAEHGRVVSECADSLESHLPVVRIDARGASLGGAISCGIRGADGDRVVLLGETAVLPPGSLAAHQRADAEEVVIAPRRALLSRWQYRLPGATSARLRNVIAAHPEHAEAVSDGGPVQLLRPEDVRLRFHATVPSLSFEDPVWERFAPLVKRYSPTLKGCPLSWLAGLGGYLSAPRRALFQAGLFEDAPGDRQIGDPEPFLALQRAGLPFRVDEAALVYHQAAPLDEWPRCAFAVIERIARRRDPIDAWLLVRYLADEDVRALADVATASAEAAAPATSATLRATIEEWLGRVLPDLRACWSDGA